jgi:hypothetical protein
MEFCSAKLRGEVANFTAPSSYYTLFPLLHQNSSKERQVYLSHGKNVISVETNMLLRGGSPMGNKKHTRRHIMAKTTDDWLPDKRADQLVMARNWIGT